MIAISSKQRVVVYEVRCAAGDTRRIIAAKVQTQGTVTDVWMRISPGCALLTWNTKVRLGRYTYYPTSFWDFASDLSLDVRFGRGVSCLERLRGYFQHRAAGILQLLRRGKTTADDSTGTQGSGLTSKFS